MSKEPGMSSLHRAACTLEQFTGVVEGLISKKQLIPQNSIEHIVVDALNTYKCFQMFEQKQPTDLRLSDLDEEICNSKK